MVKRYRIAENEWNLKNPPWSGAIGIEEVEFEQDEDGEYEVFTVPSLVCWFTRGGDQEHLAKLVVTLLNAHLFDIHSIAGDGSTPFTADELRSAIDRFTAIYDKKN